MKKKQPQEVSREKLPLDAFAEEAKAALLRYPVYLKIEDTMGSYSKYQYQARYANNKRIIVANHTKLRSEESDTKITHITVERQLWSCDDHDFMIGYLKKRYEIITLAQFIDETGIDAEMMEALKLKLESA